MAEPAFYRCGACLHAWQRMEWKLHRNHPPTCPRCGSAEQRVDQEREDAYVRGTYGPIAAIISAAVKQKQGGDPE